MFESEFDVPITPSDTNNQTSETLQCRISSEKEPTKSLNIPSTVSPANTRNPCEHQQQVVSQQHSCFVGGPSHSTTFPCSLDGNQLQQMQYGYSPCSERLGSNEPFQSSGTLQSPNRSFPQDIQSPQTMEYPSNTIQQSLNNCSSPFGRFPVISSIRQDPFNNQTFEGVCSHSNGSFGCSFTSSSPVSMGSINTINEFTEQIPQSSASSHSELASTTPVPSTRRRENTTTRSDITASVTSGSESCEGALQTEEDKCRDFLNQTCGCHLANDKKPCSSQFSMDYILDIRAQAALLSRDELDLILIGEIMAGLHKAETVKSGRHKTTTRQRKYTVHMHNGKPVTFGFLHGIGPKHELAAIKEHYAKNGLTPRVHKNTRRLPAHALTYDQQLAIMKYLQNYAEEHAILLPGRIPGYKRDDIKLLPSSCSKKVSIKYFR